MPIEFPCSGCRQQLRVPDHAAGKKAECPSCHGLSIVPHPDLTGQRTGYRAARPPAPAPAFEQPMPMAMTDPLQETVYHPRAPVAAVESDPAGRSEVPPELSSPFVLPLTAARIERENLRLASRWQRLFGHLLDWAGTLLVGAVGVASLSLLLPTRLEEVPAGEAIFGGLAAGSFLVVPLVNWWLIVRSGETIGKKVVGTRIVLESNGSVPGFWEGILLRTWLPGLLKLVFFPFFGLIDAGFVFGERFQCLHDVFARTRVVRTR